MLKCFLVIIIVWIPLAVKAIDCFDGLGRIARSSMKQAALASQAPKMMSEAKIKEAQLINGRFINDAAKRSIFNDYDDPNFRRRVLAPNLDQFARQFEFSPLDDKYQKCVSNFSPEAFNEIGLLLVAASQGDLSHNNLSIVFEKMVSFKSQKDGISRDEAKAIICHLSGKPKSFSVNLPFLKMGEATGCKIFNPHFLQFCR